VEVAKAVGGSFKLVVLAPRTGGRCPNLTTASALAVFASL